MFNKTFINIGAFLIFVWVMWSQYHQNIKHAATQPTNENIELPSGVEAKYTVNIDPNKKYADYSLVEKLVYHFYLKDKLPQPVSKQPPLNSVQTVSVTDTVQYNCTSNATSTLEWCGLNKTVSIASDSLPKAITQQMIGLAINQTITVGVPLKQLSSANKGSSQIIFFDITILGISSQNNPMQVFQDNTRTAK